MKKLSTLILLFVGLLTSCVGDVGPQGPPGFDGFDGQDGQDGADGLIGNIFEAEVSFNEANTYEAFVDFPTSIDVFDTDIVLAYILNGTDNGVDIWEPWPQTLFFDNGILLNAFDHTDSDIRFFLDGTVDFANLDPLYTDNIIYRVAIIPADFAASINTSKMSEVMTAMKVKTVKRVN